MTVADEVQKMTTQDAIDWVDANENSFSKQGLLYILRELSFAYTRNYPSPDFSSEAMKHIHRAAKRLKY